MNSYQALHTQIFSKGDFSIVPIRLEDRFLIMKWRNEQIYHLRQHQPLTEKDQDQYFNQVVSTLFKQEQPNQILFSYLENGNCIGYGGLVHINWIDKHAEISFVLSTELEKLNFEFHWSTFLSLIEQVAFEELILHKIYTYAFDVRKHLYKLLEKNGFQRDAVLNEHCYFNGKFINVIIHSKINLYKNSLFLRTVDQNDLLLLYRWANEKTVRKNSIKQSRIPLQNHKTWFTSRLNDPKSMIFILENGMVPLGQVRIDRVDSVWLIDYSIDVKYRNKGLGKLIIQLLLKKDFNFRYKALVKKDNASSIRVFHSLGFKQLDMEEGKDQDIYTFIYE